MVSQESLRAALDRVGIAEGDLVVVKADLAYLGPLDGVQSKEEHLHALYGVLRRQVGERGTLVVPASSERLCESGEDFILEDTPSEMGLLSEFLRRRPDARRSLHPFASYAAEGPLADAIVAGVSKHAFGPDTPKARLIERGAKVLNIGIPPERTNSVVHHAEQLMGVPYRYHKEFPNRVFAEGRYVGTDYLMSVRRKECQIQLNHNQRLIELFRQQGHAIQRVSVTATAVIACHDLRAMFEACVTLLKHDIYGLLVEPPRHRPYRLTC
ncbi:MAG: AAC(3) family N-acetyltransferase [Candidatus Omnitrophica bacterium]|nr:AAC(3) family N-acetyltransferase [Candidatus Omnitrophota bacterium]